MAAQPIPLPGLSLETERTPEQTLVRCSGKITSTTSTALQTAVRGLIPEGKPIVLDLTNVSYMDSSGLGALVSVYVSAKRQRCPIKLVNIGPRLQQLFRLTKLASVFEGHDEYLGWTPD
jgi:anti-sigma B factor antagonist